MTSAFGPLSPARFPLALALPAMVLVAPPAQAGIFKFAEVAPGIYRSGQLKESDFQKLKELGFRTIISLNDYSVTGFPASREQDWARRAGMDFDWRPMDPWMKPSMRYVVRLKDEMVAAEKPVLLHCHGGADRTGLVIAAYRVMEEGWSVDDAKAEMAKFDFNRWNLDWHHVLYHLPRD